MANITKNFTESELQCPCCGNVEMDSTFMATLQRVREQCAFGFKVNSGYRCESHNAKVSKNSKNDHTRGKAVDIHMTDRYDRARILKNLLDTGYFNDIAISKTFIHIGRGMGVRGVGVYG
tara:strand:- start:1411 stop:1770 length:360 start_codon:yes stop_codon:yes gene_type:complete